MRLLIKTGEVVLKFSEKANMVVDGATADESFLVRVNQLTYELLQAKR